MGPSISTDVVRNRQFGGVQLYFVLIVLCTGRDWDRIADALRRWSAKAWRFLFQAYSPKNDASLVVLMMWWQKPGDAMDANMIVKRPPKGASESSGRSKDAEFVCWYYEKQCWRASECRKMQRDHDMGQPKGSSTRDSNASFSCLADVRYVDMMRVDLNALEIGSVLLLDRNCEIQGGIACPGDRVLFAWCEEMQVLFGSESSEGDRQAPRCAILVCESESGRNVQSVDGSVRNERHEPRCVLPWMQRGYRGVCTTMDVA